MATPTSNRYPGSTVEIHFGAGSQSPGAAPIRCLAIGYGYTGGTAVVNTIYQPLSKDEARVLHGPGSALHLAAIAFYEEYPEGAFFTLQYAAAGGGVAAVNTLTITGAAVIGGTLTVELNGRFLQIAVDDAMSVANQRTRVIAEWNKQVDWPATAGVGTNAGEIDITWKWKGPTGNQIQVRALATSITGSSYAVTVKTAGATDGNPATALDALADEEYHFLIAGQDHTDATTGVPAFLAEVNTRSTPERGLYGGLIIGSTGSFGTVTALALAMNAHRGYVEWDRNSNMLTIEIAAKWAAWRAKYRQSDPTANLIKNGGDNKVFAVWRPPYSPADRITRIEATQALNSGVSSIRYTKQNTAYMVRPITTRFQDINGGPDYRTLDCIKVDMLDWFARDLNSNFPVRFPNYKLRDDSTLPPADLVADPRLIRSWIFADFLKQYEVNGWVKNVDKWNGLLEVKIPTSPSGRAVAKVPVDVIDLFAQLDVDAYQIG